jgi:class 3 adenylate cyclase
VLTAALLLVALALGAWALAGRRRAALLERQVMTAAGELEALQHAFGRFAPAQMVEDILAQGVSTRPAVKDVTILFADLKGFTTIAERLEPGQLTTLLNGYFAAAGEAIAAHRGHLAKFIGDGLLAFFGGLEPNPWQTNDALHAALAMRAALAAYNARLQADGLPTLAAGIGVHRGPVVAGVFGTAALMEYGVLGGTVNVAARVEDLTRLHDVDILVSDAVRASCDQRFRLRAMPAVEVKGLAAPLPTFALDGFDATSA